MNKGLSMVAFLFLLLFFSAPWNQFLTLTLKGKPISVAASQRQSFPTEWPVVWMTPHLKQWVTAVKCVQE